MRSRGRPRLPTIQISLHALGHIDRAAAPRRGRGDVGGHLLEAAKWLVSANGFLMDLGPQFSMAVAMVADGAIRRARPGLLGGSGPAVAPAAMEIMMGEIGPLDVSLDLLDGEGLVRWGAFHCGRCRGYPLGIPSRAAVTAHARARWEEAVAGVAFPDPADKSRTVSGSYLGHEICPGPGEDRITPAVYLDCGGRSMILSVSTQGFTLIEHDGPMYLAAYTGLGESVDPGSLDGIFGAALRQTQATEVMPGDG